jgi:signal transduction histidine kinase
MAEAKVEVEVPVQREPASHRFRAANPVETSDQPVQHVGATMESPPERSSDAIRSIAHDLNNLIGVIQGYVELLGMSELDELQRRQVGAIRGAADETRNLAQELCDCAETLDARAVTPKTSR